MTAIYSNGGIRCNILGFNFTKRDALSSVYKISMLPLHMIIISCPQHRGGEISESSKTLNTALN
jgi:hypothetical protein